MSKKVNYKIPHEWYFCTKNFFCYKSSFLSFFGVQVVVYWHQCLFYFVLLLYFSSRLVVDIRQSQTVIVLVAADIFLNIWWCFTVQLQYCTTLFKTLKEWLRFKLPINNSLKLIKINSKNHQQVYFLSIRHRVYTIISQRNLISLWIPVLLEALLPAGIHRSLKSFQVSKYWCVIKSDILSGIHQFRLLQIFPF